VYNCAVAGVSPDTLRKVPLFADLDNRELEQIASSMRERRFQPGDVVTQEGSGGVGFFVVEEGEAEVDVGGEARGSIGPGDYFGEIALINESPRTATLTAKTEMLCYGMTPWDFRPLVESNSAIAWKLLTAMAEKMKEARAALPAEPEATGGVVAPVFAHGRDADAGAAVRRVDEAAAARVDADVAGVVEEDEVAGPERAACDAAAVCQIGPARMRQGDPEVSVDEADEARAVEACVRARASPAVGDAEEVAGVRDDAGAEHACGGVGATRHVVPPALGLGNDPGPVRAVPLRRAGRAPLERAHERQHESERNGEQQYG
jgi:CRP/FNR family transcriptional regulator